MDHISNNSIVANSCPIMLLYKTAKNKPKQLLRQLGNGIQIRRDIQLEFNMQIIEYAE